MHNSVNVRKPGRAGGAGLACLILSIAWLPAGCGRPHARNPVPEDLASAAVVLNTPGLRSWGDAFSPDFQQDLITSVRQEEQFTPEVFSGDNPTVDILALSGGGADGAFGAGVLCGASATGKRPKFKLVTGISTGALIAPLAFLGSDYDPQLRATYTETTTKDIYLEKSLLKAMGSDSMMDTGPLVKMLEKYFDDNTLRKIAAEHGKGRRLFVGTTNMDAERPVIWNMGAIAAIGTPQAYKLFRQILQASSAIPVAFPPQYIEVQAGGKTYDEMHCDGGVSMQVFLYGPLMSPMLAAKEMGISQRRRRPRVFIIRNTQIKPEWKTTEGRLLPLAGRSVETLIKTQGIGDLYRIYTETRRDDLDYNLVHIPDDVKLQRREMFDRDDMRLLFDTGYKLATTGSAWMKTPPGLDAQPTGSSSR